MKGIPFVWTIRSIIFVVHILVVPSVSLIGCFLRLATTYRIENLRRNTWNHPFQLSFTTFDYMLTCLKWLSFGIRPITCSVGSRYQWLLHRTGSLVLLILVGRKGGRIKKAGGSCNKMAEFSTTPDKIWVIKWACIPGGKKTHNAVSNTTQKLATYSGSTSFCQSKVHFQWTLIHLYLTKKKIDEKNTKFTFQGSSFCHEKSVKVELSLEWFELTLSREILR